MKFVGIDLTSAFAASPRPIDIAVLDDRLNVCFFQVEWPGVEIVKTRDPGFLTRMLRQQVRSDQMSGWWLRLTDRRDWLLQGTM